MLVLPFLSGEAGVPFFHASGSEFDEVFVGTGAKRVRQLFSECLPSCQQQSDSVLLSHQIGLIRERKKSLVNIYHITVRSIIQGNFKTQRTTVVNMCNMKWHN